ncbi:MAG: polyphosphate polymerase domain-containing protein [Candidatus Cryptobacteroides sp.]
MERTIRTYPAVLGMEPITLEEMDSVKLMNRIDSKYVTTDDKLDLLLERAAQEGYRACIIAGEKITPYYSMYYDTDDLEMYKVHRAGHSVRQKIRVRTYTLTGTHYLEIKRKNNKGRTRKKRIRIPETDLGKVPEARDFIGRESRYSLDGVREACTTSFYRITLVNREKTERITLDTNLNFTNPRTGLEAFLPGTVIIELKQDGHLSSTMKRLLLELRIRPFKVSKYCIGTALTTPGLYQGRFKEKIRRMEKMRKDNNH